MGLNNTCKYYNRSKNGCIYWSGYVFKCDDFNLCNGYKQILKKGSKMFLSINDGKLPEASTDNSAGLDVFINETVEIWAGFQEVVKLGIKLDLEEVKKLEIEHNHFLDLRVRSSMRLRGLSSLGDGVIDLDYPEEFKMVIHNHNRDGRVQFRKGDKIGQLILIQHNERATWKYRQTTEQRAGGFGSTDKTMTGEEFTEMFKGK